jgi:AcrR family transcriptional regulator
MKSRAAHPARPYAQTARAEAAEATGRRIIDAFLARLLAEWFDEITLDAVAGDAAVTVQTVIRRFGGKEGLLAAAIPVFGEQVKARRAAPPTAAASPRTAIHCLLEDYELSGDAIIRLLALELRFPFLTDVLQVGRTGHREWVGTAFAPALAGTPPAAREQTLDALVIATDVYTWKLLRRDMRRTREQAAAVLEALVRDILHAPTLPHPVRA